MRTQRARVCVAYFFIGQHLLIGGNTGDAARMFRRAMDTGLKQFMPYQGAEAELRRMGLLK